MILNINTGLKDCNGSKYKYTIKGEYMVLNINTQLKDSTWF